MQEVATAKYTITGLVDIFDEQGVITGQFPIGSVQELPVEVGDKAVEEGRAEKFEGEDAPAEVPVDDEESSEEEEETLDEGDEEGSLGAEEPGDEDPLKDADVE